MKYLYIFILILVFSLSFSDLPAQQPRKKSIPSGPADTTRRGNNMGLPQDTSQSLPPSPDFERIRKQALDSAAITGQTSGIDSTITYTAKDSVIFNIRSRMMRLRGSAVVTMKEQKLEAEVIEIYFNENLLKAYGVKDSANVVRGYPKFTDKGEKFVGEEIQYNFKTHQGTISKGETELSEGFYFGSKVKRVSDNVLFVQDGKYTTCDNPHPHYFFGSPEMKVITQDRVFLDPIYFYVEDMPVFIIPFGLFFPNKTGRQSGLVVPTFFFSKDRGVAIENLGYYLALSDYYDTEFLTKFYSKGGYNVENTTRYKLLNSFDGQFRVGYGMTRFNPDQEFNTNWSLDLSHNQTFNPQTSLNARLDFKSNNYNQNVYSDPRDRTQQIATSNASFYHTFNNNSSVSIAYARTQNILTGTYTQDFPQLTYSLPNWNPLRNIVPSDSWLSDISLSYSGSAGYTYIKDIVRYDSVRGPNDTVLRATPVNRYAYKTKITHNPGISISPKFGYFSITPSIGLQVNNYFRRSSKTYDRTRDTVIDNPDTLGFFTEYNYNFGISASTKLYGVAQPHIFGVTAIRHTFTPTFGLTFAPDLSDPSLKMWGRYTDSLGRVVKYSLFEKDDGGIASSNRQQNLTYSFNNAIDIKVHQGDTVEDKSLTLLTFGLAGSYNFAADSLRFSDVSLNFQTPAFQNFSLTGSGSFSLYQEAQLRDKEGKLVNQFQKINRLLISDGRGLATLKNFNLSLRTSISSQGFSLGGLEGTQPQDTTGKKDSLALGERFRLRQAEETITPDFYGNAAPGFSSMSIHWTLGLELTYGYSMPSTHVANPNLNLRANFTFNLTSTWFIDGNLQYDFIRKELLQPYFSIRKDLHCWELSVLWSPSPTYSVFNLRLNIKAPQLQDLKIEKKVSPYY